MKTVNHLPGIATLIALVLALPASAKDQNVTRDNGNIRVQPVTAISIKPSRTIEAPQELGGEAAAPASKNEGASNPYNMPYITYEGAENVKR